MKYRCNTNFCLQRKLRIWREKRVNKYSRMKSTTIKMKCNLALWNVMGTAKVLRFFSRLQCLQILWITFNSVKKILKGFWGTLVLFRGHWYPLAVESKNKNKEKKQTKIKQTVPLFYNVMDRSQLKPPKKEAPLGLQVYNCSCTHKITFLKYSRIERSH